MASGGPMNISSKLTDSKKEVVCGICEPKYSGRRDYMKKDHFPRVHPGERYIEKGERKLSFGLFQPPRPRQDTVEETGDSLDVEDEEVVLPKVQNEALASDKGVSNEQLMEAIMRMEKMMVDNSKTKMESGIDLDDTDMKEKKLVVQGSKTIQELCIRASLTAFESEGKVMCDVCHHDDLTNDNVRKLGEINYDIFKHGDNFENRSQPREFRNLKSKVVSHMKSQNHVEMSKELTEKHKCD